MKSADSALKPTQPEQSDHMLLLAARRARRVGVLRHTFSRKRLRKAWLLARQSGLGVLWTQLRLHIAYRSRLPQPDDDYAMPPTSPVPEPYEEAAWPGDRPLVSVVIPCFNYGEFVRQAIDSVLAQTFRDFELIVVEGGSTDGHTRQVLEGLRLPGVTVLYRDEPHRVGDNRNFGIGAARGKYICCLDADDLLRPTYIEKAVFLLEHYGYDVISTAVRRFGAIEGGYGVAAAPDLEDMLAGNQVATCALFRRSLWERSGGYVDTPPEQDYVYEDWRFWVRLACYGARFVNITGEQLFLYRAHAARTSLSNAPEVKPMDAQGQMIREAEQALITPQALAQSQRSRQRCLRSTAGARNMVRHRCDAGQGNTILLAVPFLLLGGAERLLSEVVRHLRAAGYRIVIVTTLRASPECGDTTAWFEETTSEIYQLPAFLSEDRWHDFLEYLLAAKQVRLLWIVGSAFAYGALPDIKRVRPDLPIVDLLFNTVGHTESNRRYSRYIDLNLVEGEDVRRWLIDHGEAPERIGMIPSGIDLQRYAPRADRAALRQQLGFEPGSFVVGFSGRLSEEKAPLSVLHIAGQLPEQAPIRIVMTGTGALADAVRDGIRRQGLEQRVHYLGVVPDLREYLACFDVLIVPSKIDGRPNVVMEALAMGVPVIASNVGGLPELVRHGVTGFICRCGEPAEFARHIAALQADPERHRQMRAAARKFAEENLGITGMIAAYVQTLGTLTAAHDVERRPAAQERVRESPAASPLCTIAPELP